MPMPRLEVFETADIAAAPSGRAAALAAAGQAAQAQLEERRQTAYDQGYLAGQADANSAIASDQSHISADLALSLQALAFSWQEARAHVLQALAPLLTCMIERLLPEIARATLAPVVLERLMPLAAAQADQPAILLMHPAARPRVEPVLARASGLALQIQEDPELTEGQVYIRLGSAEAKIDLTRVTAEISAAVTAFFTLEQERHRDGRSD